jgi:hypothetical protein
MHSPALLNAGAEPKLPDFPKGVIDCSWILHEGTSNSRRCGLLYYIQLIFFVYE